MPQEDGKTGRFGDCSPVVIGACLEIHRALGPGLLESAYERSLALELALRGLEFEQQVAVQVTYKGLSIGEAYRIDFLIQRELIVELKSTVQTQPVHVAQLLTYMRLSNVRTGLLVNFGYETLRRGIRRLTLK